MSEDGGHGGDGQSAASQVFAAGSNMHGQLLGNKTDNLFSFEKIYEIQDSNLQVWLATWSNSIFKSDQGLVGIGHQKVDDKSKVSLTNPIGDHNGIILALDSEGRLYSAEEQTDEDAVTMVCQSTDSSPLIGRLAYAENGRVAITIKQAPNGNLCHVEEFKELAAFLRWFEDPSGEGNYPGKHFMLPGRPKHLVANTGTFMLLMESGEVYTWGDPRYQSLGRPTSGEGSKSADEPGVVEALEGLRIRKAVCCGWMSAALSEDGALYLWGITSPSEDVKINALHAGEGEELALVELPGNGSDPLDVLDVALGVDHIAVLAENDRLFVVGDNSCGQLGIGHEQGSSADWQEVTLQTSGIHSVFCGVRSTFAVTGPSSS